MAVWPVLPSVLFRAEQLPSIAEDLMTTLLNVVFLQSSHTSSLPNLACTQVAV